LYRKYRPRCFGDVAGQEHVTETLKRQITLGRLSHAYLFVGTRGTGKTTCAKILSRAVNCRDPIDGEPCNECLSCLGIENGSILDVLELDAASNNGVDNVRALREEAIYTPASVARRIYIIDEVHMLSTAAFNALLKILEEPPEHLIFILATTELHKVPATILPRCQRFSFKRLSSAVIAERLKVIAGKEGLSLTDEAAEKLAALADGSMRDGISLLDQCACGNVVDLQRVLDTVGLAGQQELLRLAVAAAERKTAAALEIFDALYGDGKDIAALLSELAGLTRDLLVYKLSVDSPLLSGGFSRTELSALSEKLSSERLFLFLDITREAISGLSRGGNAKLQAEMCRIRMCDERLSDDVASLLARVAKLEDSLESGSYHLGAVSSESLHAGESSVSPPSEPHPEDSLFSPPTAPHLEESPITIPSALQVEEPRSAPLPTPDTEERDFWQEILELLQEEPPVYALLSDGAKIRAEQREGVLIIRTENKFTATQIESKRTSEPLKEAAGKVLGREIVVRVETGGDVGDTKRDKLDSLSAFSIVNFE